jgi:hypothetical protein
VRFKRLNYLSLSHVQYDGFPGETTLRTWTKNFDVEELEEDKEEQEKDIEEQEEDKEEQMEDEEQEEVEVGKVQYEMNNDDETEVITAFIGHSID